MIKKEMLIALLAVGCVANNAFSMNEKDAEWFAHKQGVETTEKSVKQPQVFNKGRVSIAGNDLFSFLHMDGYQTNPSPEFEKTTIVKFKKNGTYQTQFQLRDLRKARGKEYYGSLSKQRDSFERYAKANNAIECPDLIELPNRDGELKPVTVAIYGTQNVKHCQLYKEYMQQQKDAKDIESMMADQY